MKRAAASVLLLLWGCGLDEAGENASGDGGGGDVTTIDVVVDVHEEPVVCSDAGTASCNDAVPFRTPALYAADRNTACPAGYDTQDLVLAVPNGTCSCTCNDAGAPSCDTTLANIHYGFNGNCNSGNVSSTLNGCTATDLPTFANESVEIDTPKLVGGCGGPGTAVQPPVTSTNVRLCTPGCASDESVCTGLTGLRACVVVAGNVASCPTNYASGPFYIGANPTVTCDSCSCSQTGDCTGSTTHLYTDTVCGAGDETFAMDGQCHALTNAQINGFHSAQIKPSVKNAACQGTPSAAHTMYGGNDLTVCCQ